MGSIQEKITVCAFESTYPVLQERVSQPKESRSRAAVELQLGKGIAALKKAGENHLLGKGSVCCAPGSKQHRPTTSSPRASVQSLVQLLALQPHYKHELMQRLQGMQVDRLDWGRLLATLEEVAELDPTECCYRLKEGLASWVREDWPGYTAQERKQEPAPQTLSPILLGASAAASRWLLPSGCQEKPSGGDPRGSKRSRALESAPGLQGWHRSHPQVTSMEQLGAQGQQQAGPLPLGSQAGEKQSSEREASTEEADDDWEEGDLNLEQHLPAPRDARSQASSSSSAEIPDYLRKYRTICSVEQRRAYEAAFSADYTEYRYLHARIGNVSQKFIQLGAKMKTLKQGTEERKALEATILHEYSHFKKTYPSYQQEKHRCEYLHQKLSHIKNLILQFEESRRS
ncbi:RNA polymerase II elongation factor ELL3 isoform X2 [Struthio camelus]|uniref:RNA polymerase II elongation factor ELL3 isoform X2 n=1 Tax=Struthio camelus TaxID=8801 RepID=UPI003603BBDB